MVEFNPYSTSVFQYKTYDFSHQVEMLQVFIKFKNMNQLTDKIHHEFS